VHVTQISGWIFDQIFRKVGWIFRQPWNRLRTWVRVIQIYGRIFDRIFAKVGQIFHQPWNRLRTRARVIQISDRIFGWIFTKVHRIFRSPLKSAKDQKTARCVSIRSMAGYLVGHFQKWAGISGPNLTQIFRPWRLQWLHFGEGYKYPSPSSSSSCSSSSRTRHYLETTSLLDLHLQPPKVSDLWRIKGGGPDLHLHRRNFFFPSFCLRDSFLVVPSKH
jgi:hypothetical protein